MGTAIARSTAGLLKIVFILFPNLYYYVGVFRMLKKKKNPIKCLHVFMINLGVLEDVMIIPAKENS